MNFKHTLEAFEQELQSLHSPVLNYFNPGLKMRDVVSIFQEIGVTPSDELISLYCWKNGVRWADVPSEKLALGVTGVFLPLADSVDAYNAYQEVIGDKFLFPVLFDDTYFINLNKLDSGFSKIFIYSPSLLVLEPTTCFESIENMFETFRICLSKNICSYDVDGIFRQNYEAFNNECAELNPTCDYWKNLKNEKGL